MARIGLNNFRYSVLTEGVDGTPTYAGAKKPAKAISCSVDISNNSAVLYADDAVAESDTSFQSGTCTIGIDDDNVEMMAEMLGHTYDADSGVMTRSANDVAPYVGFGRVIVKMVNNVRQYKVEFLYKVKFGEPSQEDNTKGESLEFATSEMEGMVSALADGRWSETATFATQAEAIAYLEGLLGGAESETTYTVTYNAGGGTNAPSAVTVTAGTMIKLNDGSGLTPPSNKHFIGWDTNSSSTTADLTGTYIVNANVTLYAIYASN